MKNRKWIFEINEFKMIWLLGKYECQDWKRRSGFYDCINEVSKSW